MIFLRDIWVSLRVNPCENKEFPRFFHTEAPHLIERRHQGSCHPLESPCLKVKEFGSRVCMCFPWMFTHKETKKHATIDAALDVNTMTYIFSGFKIPSNALNCAVGKSDGFRLSLPYWSGGCRAPGRKSSTAIHLRAASRCSANAGRIGLVPQCEIGLCSHPYRCR